MRPGSRKLHGIYGKLTRVHWVRRISRSARQLFLGGGSSNGCRAIAVTARNSLVRLKIDHSTVVWQACCTPPQVAVIFMATIFIKEGQD